ncbi:MAG: hypothetical protein A2511_14825 [Deltaproteobacteria bacterium RIFOXYD12_FULL_50_9]|nr:MAG: hypothetical protein A2511_14825 [Deltaproteobacteria bacterium RIFOXYD12_FULL_50_9]
MDRFIQSRNVRFVAVFLFTMNGNAVFFVQTIRSNRPLVGLLFSLVVRFVGVAALLIRPNGYLLGSGTKSTGTLLILVIIKLITRLASRILPLNGS